MRPTDWVWVTRRPSAGQGFLRRLRSKLLQRACPRFCSSWTRVGDCRRRRATVRLDVWCADLRHFEVLPALGLPLPATRRRIGGLSAPRPRVRRTILRVRGQRGVGGSFVLNCAWRALRRALRTGRSRWIVLGLRNGAWAETDRPPWPLRLQQRQREPVTRFEGARSASLRTCTKAAFLRTCIKAAFWRTCIKAPAPSAPTADAALRSAQPQRRQQRWAVSSRPAENVGQRRRAVLGLSCGL